MKEIYELYRKFKKDIHERLNSFTNLPQEDYFYELCYCLLTPATKAEYALCAVDELKKRKFFEIGFDPTNVLRGNEISKTNENKFYIRFHYTKSKRLILARENWDKILSIVNSKIPPFEKRNLLLQNVRGFGLKEASHFLRNIGYRDFAVLDRHIIKNLISYEALPGNFSLSSKKKYLEAEQTFFHFAHFLGISPSELDLLFWAKETGYVLK